MIKFFLAVSAIICLVHAFADWSADMNPDKWNKQAKENIYKILSKKRNQNIAKNLILFLGDGMGITTVTAGRILKGQKEKRNGEEVVKLK